MEFFEFLEFLEAEALGLCAKFEAFFSSELLEFFAFSSLSFLEFVLLSLTLPCNLASADS